MEKEIFKKAVFIQNEIKRKQEILNNFEKRGKLIEIGIVHEHYPMGERTKYTENKQLINTIEILIVTSLRDEILKLQNDFNCL